MFIPWSFSPLVLRPALWLDASDASTLYSGASLAAADGAISEWRDKSGNARHATQATGVSQPLRKTAIQNGRDVVRFDGANDGLKGTLVNLSAMTVFVVFKYSAARLYDRVYTQATNALSNDYSASGHYIPVIQSSASQTSSYASADLRSTVATASNTFAVVASKHTGSEITNYKNGAAGTPYTHTLGVNGGAYGIGSTPTENIANMTGDISEILVFPTALSDADRQAVETYLNAKWAIY